MKGRWSIHVTPIVVAGLAIALAGALALVVAVVLKGLQPGSSIPSEPALPTPDRVAKDPESGAPLVRDELIVALDFDAPSEFIAEIAEAFNATVIGSVPELKTYQLQFEVASIAELGVLREQILAYSPLVNAVSRSWLLEDSARTPNDKEFDSWEESSPAGNNWGLEFIRAPSAWDRQTGSGSVKVAIVDNDFDTGHEDLAGNLVKAEYYGSPRDGREKGDGHGTHVAGTACAVGNNGRGIAGVTWSCGLMLYNYAGASQSLGDQASVIYRMDQAARDGARVVNLSWGFIDGNQCPGFYDESTRRRAEEMNSILSRPLAWAENEGRDVLWVIAAGNECRDVKYQSPASLVESFPDNVITVASVGPSGTRARSSNYGQLISVAAPGVDIFSTCPESSSLLACRRYGTKSGTSSAAPHVTGLAALVMAQHPSLDAAKVKECIVGGAQLAGRKVTGHGFFVIDAPRALKCETRTMDELVTEEKRNQEAQGWTVCGGSSPREIVGTFDHVHEHWAAIFCRGNEFGARLVVYERNYNLLTTISEIVGGLPAGSIGFASNRVLYDVNGDGTNELPVIDASGGNSPTGSSTLRIYGVLRHEILELPILRPLDGLGGAASTGPAVPSPAVGGGGVLDADGDGTDEVIVADAQWRGHGFGNVSSPFSSYVLVWDGDKFVNASRDARFQTYFDKAISSLELNLAACTRDSCRISMAVSIALNYGHSGRATQAWERFHQIAASLTELCWQKALPDYEHDLELSVPKDGSEPTMGQPGVIPFWPPCI